MEQEKIIEVIMDYLREKYDLGDDPDFAPDVDLFDYGFVDSLGATELTLYLEDTYHIEITQRDIVLYPMRTVEEIAAVVAEKV